MQRRLAEELRSRWKRDRMEAAEYLLWDAVATVKHWFGVHTMIANEEWDFDQETVRFRGSICWKCNHRGW
jgi:hypothetical protein